MSALQALESYISTVLGRRVRGYGCSGGLVLRWDPLNHSLCDALILLDDNTEVWFALSSLHPADRNRPLPDRSRAVYLSAIERVESLREFRDSLIRDFNKPWPGMEWGKAILGMATVKALEEAENELALRNTVTAFDAKCKISR